MKTTIAPTATSVPLVRNGYVPTERIPCPVCPPSAYHAIRVRRARLNGRVLAVHASCHRLDLDGIDAITWAMAHDVAGAEGWVP